MDTAVFDVAGTVKRILSSSKYRDISEETVRDVVEQVLSGLEGGQRRSKRQTYRKIRERLHRIWASYLGLPEFERSVSSLKRAFESGEAAKDSNIQVSDNLIKVAKDLLKTSKNRKTKKNLFFGGAVVFFGLSFFIPKYFMQFLVVTLVLGMRWAFESEGGRTLIMVIDSWRRHSHDDNDEISQRLKDRFKSYHE